MNTHIKKEYLDRKQYHSDKMQYFTSRSKLISIMRLLTFLVAAVLLYVFARSNWAPGIIITIFISLGVFIILVKLHGKILLQKKTAESLVEINNDEINCIDGKFDQFDGGVEFDDPEHLYSSDLDIFGEGSLYQFVNRSATHIGEVRLSEKLKTPELDIAKIIENQQFVTALSQNLDWRQEFLAIGKVYGEKKDDKEKIINWSKLLPFFNHPIFLVMVILIPILTATMIYLVSSGILTDKMFLIYMAIPWGIAGSYAIKVNTRHMMVSKTSETLVKYARLLNLIENVEFDSTKFIDLKGRISTESRSSSISIKKLSSILNALDNRLNFVSWALLNGLFLWDILQMKRLEHWQKKHASDIQNWFEVIDEIDTMNSFANYAYNHPKAIIPQINDKLEDIEIKDLGHPLINQEVRVNNDVSIKHDEFKIITGANMAGKSTYLRTIGVNLVLAMCGAPICAESFSFKPVQIFTSIRTRDSLQKNESYFYAELKRLQAIIQKLKEGSRLFIILDEILKGTNSKDKHAGSEALLKQLIKYEASGIVATHDVGLGQLESIFPDNIKNNCFEVDIVGNKLHFDYKLRQGVSQNLNATFLMREMGITI